MNTVPSKQQPQHLYIVTLMTFFGHAELRGCGIGQPRSDSANPLAAETNEHISTRRCVPK